MRLDSNNTAGGSVVWLLPAVIGVTFTALYLFTPFSGDDWAYMGIFRAPEGYEPEYQPWQFWLFELRHWWMANGRTANFMAAVTLGAFPKWLIDIGAGLAAAAGALLMIRLGGVWRNQGYMAAAVVTAALYALLFPWWDMMFTIDFAFNYPVTLAIVLGAVYMMERSASATRSGCITVLAAIAGVVAGSMHESASMPLAAGFGIWIWRYGKWATFSRLQRVEAVAFAIGTAFATLAPGIIKRAIYGGAGAPDDVAWVLVVKSAPLTLIILAAFVVSLLSGRVRRRVPELLVTPALAWGLASLIALLPVATGGIVGRSGWFSQAYAMIFALYWIRIADIRLPRAVATALAVIAGVATTAQSVATVVTAAEFHSLITRIDSEWQASDNGIVYATDIDFTTEPWWTLQRIDHRTQENYYERLNMTRYYRHRALPVILPPEAAAVNLDTVTTLALPGGVTITTIPAAATATTDTLSFASGNRQLYLSFPRRTRAWGERR